ncbi:hypothetical protein DFR30_2484 [Thiogranum longum]|uniref:Uncharacterized protein n=1 Tax=Thiogranum longum TaxID=1537524 RepID=A0A4R1HB58_9GAMM|nr:hypothetical protein [Thiogranum longum]TCK19187.1 hypothetical protein DFR30_2484 [Thiogranum longum]
MTACAPASAESSLPNFTNSDGRLAHDEVIAHIPRHLAETPSVALAKFNIVLYRAKHLTEQRLCEGKWTPRGALLYQYIPGEADTRPHTSGNKPGSWLVQTFRSPVNLACPDTTRAEYFLEMSRHLPAWISVRPAGQITVFRLGQAFTGGQHPLAAR